jgi:hypothetical protein
MPQNAYVSATLAVTRQSLKLNGTQSDTDTGFGGQLAAGKEWWVSDHWGLGVAGKFTFFQQGRRRVVGDVERVGARGGLLRDLQLTPGSLFEVGERVPEPAFLAGTCRRLAPRPG